LDWRVVGAAHWPAYRACIAATLEQSGADAVTTFGALGAAAGKWVGGVLAPNGMIYGIPDNSMTVLKIDPTTDTATTFGSLVGATKWMGGVLAPNGMIYGIPYSSATVLKIDPDSAAFCVNVIQSAYLNKF
jgi:hypothetical protein